MSQCHMADPYTDPDSQPESARSAMMERLEDRGRHAGFSGMIARYVATLPAARPLTVLDLGCGTGVVTRHLAAALHPGSRVHGADVSATLLEEAARLSSGARVTWDHVAPGPLPYADGTFDAVTMHTVLSHVPEPSAVLRQVHHVLKPGGRLIVFDADHAGTTYSQPTHEATRRIDHLLTSAIAAQPGVCRQMPRLLKSAGFRLESHAADIISECGRGDYWLSSVHGFARLMPTLRILPEDEAQAWVDHMLRSHEEGTFFAAGAFYTFHAVSE